MIRRLIFTVCYGYEDGIADIMMDDAIADMGMNIFGSRPEDSLNLVRASSGTFPNRLHPSEGLAQLGDSERGRNQIGKASLLCLINVFGGFHSN